MIGTILTVSTGHITEADSKKLEAAKYIRTSAPLLATYDEGFFLYALPSDLDLMEELEMMRKEGYSEAFTELYKYAVRDLGVSMLRLDSDGDELNCFELYEW